LRLHTHASKRAPDVILQSELGVLAEFEARYFASVKDVADRVASGCYVEEGPLAIDAPVMSSRADAGAVVVPACVTSREYGLSEASYAASETLVQTLERLSPMSRLLHQADFDFMLESGLSRMSMWRLRYRRVRLYFDYVRLLTGIVDGELAEWARYLGQPHCTFESLDRARWQMKRTLWLLRLDGVRFGLHLPLDSQSAERRLGEIRGLIFDFRGIAA